MKNDMNDFYKKGDIVWVNLKGEGSLQNGKRPCLVVSSDRSNLYSPLLTVIPFTSKKKKHLPFHVNVLASPVNGLKSDSTLLVEQKVPVNKSDVFDKVGKIEQEYHTLIGYATLWLEPILTELLSADFIRTNEFETIKRIVS